MLEEAGRRAGSHGCFMADSRVRSVDVSIPTAEGRHLGGRVHQPWGTPHAQVLIHGATAVPSGFYRAYAEHLAGQGFRVLTYDYRGIGASRSLPLRSDPVTMRDWIDDASAAQRWLNERAPVLPLLVIGHSFGGQIAATIEGGRRADALVLVGAQGGWYGRFPQPARTRLWLSLRVLMPGLVKTFGYLPAWTGLGEDLPPHVALQWARWCSSSEYYLSELPELAPRLRSFSGRMLALSFSDDDFAPLENVRWLLDKHGSAAIDHLHLRPQDEGVSEIGHFGFFRRTAGPRLWPRVDAFLHAAAGHGSFGTWRHAPAATSLTMQEVLADLAHGRP